MKDKQQNITENKINPTNTFVGVDALVGMPPLQLNEIYNDDSFELCKRVPAKTVDLILEDMPYNTTACEWDVKIDLQLYWETRLRILKPTGVICLTASQPFTSELVMSNIKMFKYEWIWEKNLASNFAAAKYVPMKEHENILIFYKAGVTYNEQRAEKSESGKQRAKYIDKPFQLKEDNVYGKFGFIDKQKEHYRESETRHPSTLLKFNCERGLHSTQKPVGLFEYLIRTYTNEGDLVFDGFGGSGTTAIAAHKSKRNFIVIEKEKKYFDLAVRRLDIERAQYTIL